MKYLFFVFALIVFNAIEVHAQEIVSPNKIIKVVVSENAAGSIQFKIMYKKDSGYVEVLPNSPLGISRKDQQFVDGLIPVKVSDPESIHDKYTMITGKRKDCENFGTEKVFSYKNSNNQPLDIIFRIYNDGVAFRYDISKPFRFFN